MTPEQLMQLTNEELVNHVVSGHGDTPEALELVARLQSAHAAIAALESEIARRRL